MTYKGILEGLAVSVFLAVGINFSIQGVQGQVQPAVAAGGIESLTEQGERLEIRDSSPDTGFVTFASSRGNGLLLPADSGASAEIRARSFVQAYGRPFGIADGSQLQLLSSSPVDAVGLEHVKFQQYHLGVPVRGAEFVVHLRGARAMAVNGRVIGNLPAVVIPSIAGNVAIARATSLIDRRRAAQATGAVYSEPRLEIFNSTAISDPVNRGSRLAWFIEVTGPRLREFVWVDAQNGAILLSFSQIADAKNRRVHSAGFTNTLPGTLRRSEGGPATGVADEDNAYTFAGHTYDYFFNNHGRDSFDNAGGVLISTTDYCEDSCPEFANAFWNGAQMVYGHGYASADDVVGHELTHAVTERSAGLLYYYQSGALNESFSDIFGEVIDLTNGAGNDAAGVRWQMGEDLVIGAIRNMMNPNQFNDPSRMGDSARFFCTNNAWTDPGADSGGVHINSGVPNHAFALMVDGGTFNGRTVTGIGITKAAKIQYRALTTYLTSGSTFLDDYNALNQSCTDLIGTIGITAGDCTQVTTALQAVEMNNTWGCSGATAIPPLCPAGVPVSPSVEGFETSLGNWTATNTPEGSWARDSGFARAGTRMAYGSDEEGLSDHLLSMTAPITVPTGGRMYFDHAFEFENDFIENYDGGVLEYSTNGTTWLDAAALIDAGQTYNGTLASGSSNPLTARQAFTKSSFGYTGTRLNLNSLAGQNVRFRFRIGTDEFVGALGWVVDNISFYTCSAGTAPGAPAGVTAVPGNAQATVSFTPPASNGGSPITSYRATASPGGATATGSASPIIVTGLTNGVAYTFTVTATNAIGTSPPSAPSSAVTPAAVPGPPTNVVAVAGNGQATISFAAPASSGGAPITSYTATASPGGATVSGPGSPVVVAGLTNGTSYTFTVTATNSIGTSSPSAPSNAVTPQLPTPGTPINFNVSASGLSITGTWTAVGAAATSHLLEVGVNASFVPVVFALPLGPESSFSLDAPPGTNGTFFFRVTAMNALGASAPTAGVGVAIPGVPSAPGPPVLNNAVVSGSNVTLNWQPGPGGAPSSYTLIVGSSSGASNIGVFPMGSLRSITANAPDGTYFARVQASNVSGSAVSNEISFTVGTPCVPPSAPTSVTASRSGSVITVNWAPPAIGSGPFTYTLIAGSSSGASNVGTFPLGGALTISTGAPPGTYFFRLRAANGCGVSSDSAEVSVGVP